MRLCACTHRVHLTKYAPPRTRCVHPYAPHESTTLEALNTLAVLVQRLLIKRSHRALVFHSLVHRDGVMNRDKGVEYHVVSWRIYANGPFAYVSPCESHCCIVLLRPTFLSSIRCLLRPSTYFIYILQFEFKDNLATREKIIEKLINIKDSSIHRE